MENLLNSICNELTFRALLIQIYPHVCCCVDNTISLNVYCISTDADNTAINNIYFYSLLSIDKTKENNSHNKILDY